MHHASPQATIQFELDMYRQERFMPGICMLDRLRALAIAPLAVVFGLSASVRAANAETERAEHFRKDVKPILTDLCFDCHADGAKKGNVELDKFKTDAELLNDRELWFNVLKYVRSDVMPPSKKTHPNAEQKQ